MTDFMTCHAMFHDTSKCFTNVSDVDDWPTTRPAYLQGLDPKVLRPEGKAEAPAGASAQVAFQVKEALADEDR